MRGNFGHVEPHSDGRMRLDCLIYQKYGSEIQEREPSPILRPFNKPKTVRSGQMGNLYCTVLANSPCCRIFEKCTDTKSWNYLGLYFV